MPNAVISKAGLRGFDCDRQITPAEAKKFFDKAYRFVVRYIVRQTPHDRDLSAKEIGGLFNSGLAVMPVQHVESESDWIPSLEKGLSNGNNAARAAATLGFPTTTNVWLDLEGVNTAVDAATVVQYCNTWFDRVKAAGFTPGIYVGWHCGLSPDQLYRKLEFQHYWAAYNLNRDEEPTVRGIQMKQGAAKKSDKPSGVVVDMDTDVIMADNLGGLPIVYAPDEWSGG